MNPIPFNRISFDSGELTCIEEAVGNGHISGDGPFSKKAETILSEMHDGSKVLLTPSCSHALELAARLLDLEPGDEVIVPSFTFVTSVSSFVSHGATPVFCDIDPITLGLNLEEARKLVTPKTRAIVLVHYGGVPANPEGFAKLAKEHNLVLIEDNAHGLGGKSNGKTLGTFGAMSTLSFHETKNITCGEGGALVINDPEYIERAEILREKGTDRSRFFRGQIDKYTWQDLGSSWILSDILAAVLYAQLSNLESIQRKREDCWNRYFEGLKQWALIEGAQIQEPGSGTAHLFYIITRSPSTQNQLLNHLRKFGVDAVFHYQALHHSPFGRQNFPTGTLPVTLRATDSLIRLPLHGSMSDIEISKTIDAVRKFKAHEDISENPSP